MTQDVLLTISGLHTLEPIEGETEENEPIEVITPASYYQKNGKQYILYDEPVEGFSGVIKNKIKINGEQSLEIIKTGITNAHMVFEKDKMNVTYYDTPYGQIQVGTHTRNMKVDTSEELITVEVEYSLDVNQEAAADCHITLSVQPRNMRVL